MSTFIPDNSAIINFPYAGHDMLAEIAPEAWTQAVKRFLHQAIAAQVL